MRLSTRTRYGIRAMLALAINYGKGPLGLKNIAEDQDISVKYLEQLFTVLKAAGFITSVRGAKGGYQLAKPPAQINLNDCVNCLEGQITTVECVQNDSFCAKAPDCVMKQVWTQVNEAIQNILTSITFQDLVDKTKETETSDYQI